MDIGSISALIGSLGFPCAISIILLYMLNKQQENHKQEMDTLRDSLNNNTLAIQHLTDIINRGENNDRN